MAETETDIPKMKPRPIVRLGLFLMSHSLLASIVCCSAGVLALLLLPVLAKNTYISENALMPGSANPMLSNQDIVQANKLAEDLSDLDFKSAETAGIQRRRLIAQYISNLGAEASYHKFHPPMNRFHPLHFFATPDSEMIEGSTNCSIYGVNMVGIIRAPRGDGKEAIVLVTPYNFGRSSQGETLSLSIAFSVFSLLTRVTWLAKDIIWLVADAQFGEYPPVAAWLRDYHTPAFGSFGTLGAEMCCKTYNIYELEQDSIEQRNLTDGLKRAGTMAAALVINVADKNEPFEDSLGMYVEASNGQMPNLDLINIVNYLAVHRQGLRVKVEKFWSLLGSKWLKILGEVFESLGEVAKSLNPQWKFGIPAADYVEGTATLVSSLYYQALGIPTGAHGAFRDFQVDAITLEISPRVSSTNKGRRNEFLLRGGRLIEGVIRSVNNLLEKFHQSFFLYLLTSPSKFVSVGVYMIPFALLVAPLPLVAASLYADGNSKNLSPQNGKSTSSTTVAADELGITFRSWKWLNAARKVFVVHVWGAIVSLLPYFISQIPDCSPEYRFGIWVIFSLLVLLILYFILGFQLPLAQVSRYEKGEWAILKSVTISAVFIGLCLMSVINFATAEIGALLMVPTCLLACPLKLDTEACNLKSVTRMVTNLVLVTLSFPPVAFFVLKGVVEGHDGSNVGDFWIWVESLWAWNSATYLYMGMVHLPCWVLCLHVLLHSC
ncbi:GPI transamidase component family protein [Tripterygium wilfordii]|uniref:GPI transamidase component family protein n=1 Tax=Tripterygium wilfordii TaxID=458696 RepID=A0A7J7D2D9_TRIWF|nr:glycosylphosphatidylinositol anchor attachment 1 protein [Tripterygium wilfordii]KAF5740409.1 GPI transamidase component family protein [Tripterygium wilfordii]